MSILTRFAARLAGMKEWFYPSIRDRESLLPGTVYEKADITSWLLQARMGETRYLSAFKAEMRALDPDLDSHIRKLEAHLAQAPFEIQRWPPEKASKSGAADGRRADEIAMYCRDQIMDPDISRASVVTHALWGLLEGVAGFQVLVKPGIKEKLWRIDLIPSERFRWAQDSTKLLVQPGDNYFETIPVEDLGDSIAVCVADPHIVSRDRVGVLRRCVAPWLVRRNGLEWWASAVERFGQPWVKAKYKDGLKEDTLNKLEKMTRAVGPAGYGLFPASMDVEFVEGLKATTGTSPHLSMIEYCERAMAKAILGSTQTADIQRGAGSLASASVHADVVEMFAEAYARQVCEFIRQGILKPLVRRNFGPDAAEQFTPMPVIRAKKNDDLLTFFQAMETAKKAGFTDVPAAWIHERTGIPVPEDDEETLEGEEPETLPSSGPDTPDPEEPEDDPAPEPAEEPMSARRVQHKELLSGLEDWATQFSRGAGDPIVEPYAALIKEVKRDGGDLGHLAARVRLEAQMAGEPKEKIVNLIAAVLAQALLAGYESEPSKKKS